MIIHPCLFMRVDCSYDRYDDCYIICPKLLGISVDMTLLRAYQRYGETFPCMYKLVFQAIYIHEKRCTTVYEVLTQSKTRRARKNMPRLMLKTLGSSRVKWVDHRRSGSKRLRIPCPTKLGNTLRDTHHGTRMRSTLRPVDNHRPSAEGEVGRNTVLGTSRMII